MDKEIFVKLKRLTMSLASCQYAECSAGVESCATGAGTDMNLTATFTTKPFN